MQRLIDANHLEQSLPASSPADNNHVMTRHFAVESFRALIKAEPTVTPPPIYAKGILLDEIQAMDTMADATAAGRGYGVAGGQTHGDAL